MVGAVAYFDLLVSGRRGRLFAFRWLYAAWLVVQLLFLHVNYLVEFYMPGLSPGEGRNFAASGRFGQGYVEVFLLQQFAIILLATPAFVAGAVTEIKKQGTLECLMTGHLSAGEILLGRLLARLAQVALLLLAGLPVLCFFGVFGGLRPGLLLAFFVLSALLLFGLGSAGMLASIWSRHTRNAVLGLYGALSLVVLVLWGVRQLPATTVSGSAVLSLLAWLGKVLDPIEVLRPGWETGNLTAVGRRLAGAALAWGTIGGACLALAAWRLRTAFMRQLEGAGRRRSWAKSLTPVPESGDPVSWKERIIHGLMPPVPLPRWLMVALVGVASFLAAAAILWWCRLPAGTMPAPPGPPRPGAPPRINVINLIFPVDGGKAETAFLVLAIGVLVIASLVVGARCSAAVTGERERQTWDALLLTPLEARHLIRGKLWGIVGAAVPFLAAYLAAVLPVAVCGGLLAFFWIALFGAVTFLAMYYMGAAGLCCSVRCKSSWRSLFLTLGLGYAAMFLCYAVASPIIAVVFAIVYFFLKGIDDRYGTRLMQTLGTQSDLWGPLFIASGLALAAIFFVAARLFVAHAEKHVADVDRVRHWEEERPRRRQPEFALQRR